MHFDELACSPNSLHAVLCACMQFHDLACIYYINWLIFKIWRILLFNILLSNEAKKRFFQSWVWNNIASGSLLMHGVVWKRRGMVCVPIMTEVSGIFWHLHIIICEARVAKGTVWPVPAQPGLISHSHVHYSVTGHQIVTPRPPSSVSSGRNTSEVQWKGFFHLNR